MGERFAHHVSQKILAEAGQGTRALEEAPDICEGDAVGVIESFPMSLDESRAERSPACTCEAGEDAVSESA